MNLLAAYPLVHALGWTLLHFCWQGAAIAVLLWCLLGTVGASSRRRYAASCIALGLLVAVPLITFARLAVEDYRLAAIARRPIPAADIFVTAVTGGATSPWTVRLSALLDRSMPLLLAVWCLGVFCFLVRLSLGLVAAHRLRTQATIVSADLQELFVELCTRLGITRVVQLLNSVHVEAPTVVGWLRPVVLLPASCLLGLTPDQIEAILCHELAHVRRHDYLVSVLQSVVETLLFYHPAVWWVSKQIRRERECCCDEFAVSSGGNVLAYARALSFLEEQRALAPQLALGANGGVLKMRIQRLLGRPQNSTTSQIASIAVLALFTLSALTLTARHVWAEVHSSQRTSATAPSSASPENNTAVGESQTKDMGIEFDRIREAQNQQAGLRVRLDEIRDGQARYSALLAQAGQQPQLSDEDRNRLEETARRLTDSLDAWVDQLQREIDARGVAIDRFNSPEFQKQMQDATARINSAEFKRQLADAQAQVKMLNGSDFHRQLAELQASLARIQTNQQQMEAAKAAMSEIDSAHLQKHIEAAIAKLNSPEFRRQMDEATKEIRRRLQQQAAQSSLLARNAEPAATEVPSSAQSIPSGPVRVSSGVMAGMVISQPAPVYPAIAKAAHVQGVVVLHAIVSKDGTVEKLTVVSGPPMLVQSAVDAVQKWTYQPFMVNRQPVEVETTINVNYTFGGPDLSCTYYDKGVQHAGTCEQDKTSTGNYSCRADDDQTLVQPQIGCESKVKGLQESQHSNLSPSEIHAPLSGAPRIAFVASNGSESTDQAGNTLRKIGGNVTPPQVIHQVAPEFSDEARMRLKAEGKDGKFEGQVLVQLIVDGNGQPENVHVVRGIGMGLDQKAVEAIHQYRFRPAMENGKPVPVLLNVEVNFKSF